MWTSWRGRPRDQLGLVPVLDLADPAHSSAAVVSAARIRSASGTPSMLASWAALRPGRARRPCRAGASRAAASPSRCRSGCAPAAAGAMISLAPSPPTAPAAAHRLRSLRRLAEHAANVGLVEVRQPRRAKRKQERVRQAAVRIVRREQDLLGSDLPHQVDEVEDAPHRGVEEHSRHVCEVAREPAEVGDAGVGDDQPDTGIALDEGCEVVADRRQSAAAVNQDRHVALDREREDGVEPLVADGELLGAGMELDPARAEVEAPLGLLDRAFRRGRGARTG